MAAFICAHLATRPDADLEGKDWERIFAECIGASWTPSNVGLDDITHQGSSTAWGAKTVKGKPLGHKNSNTQHKVRLISGRNSPDYSFNVAVEPNVTDPDEVGKMVLGIWNTRVKEVRSKYSDLRTSVLIKGDGLETVSVFELDTQLYMTEQFKWEWNKNSNLEGCDLQGDHHFTWQPHGSQFTIIESVPEDALKMRIKAPRLISATEVLERIGFDDSFYEVL